MAKRWTYRRIPHWILSVFMNSLILLNEVFWIKNVLNIWVLLLGGVLYFILWKRFILLIVDSCKFVSLLFFAWGFLFFEALYPFILIIELRNQPKYFKDFIPHFIVFESKPWSSWFNICKLENKCWNV